MDIKGILKRAPVEQITPKKNIPKGAGLFLIAILGIIGIVAIITIIFDDYTLSAYITEKSLYWHDPPRISRMWIGLAFVITAVLGHIFLPIVHYVGEYGKPKLALYWYIELLDDDTAQIHIIGGKRILAHKNRIKSYLFSLYIAGEYKYYVGDNETVILEGDNYEISAINTLRKRVEITEKEAALWRYKYMELLENIKPFMNINNKKDGGGDNGDR